MQAILVDLGREWLRIGLTDASGKIVDRRREKTSRKGPFAFVGDYARMKEIDLKRNVLVVASPGPFQGDSFVPRNAKSKTDFKPIGMPPEWAFSVEDFEHKLGVKHALVVHDMIAVATGLSRVQETDQRLLSGAPVGKTAHGPIVAIQTGMGLGLAALIPSATQSWFPFSGEGGSQIIGPMTDDEAEIYEIVKRDDPFGWGAPTAQHLLTGPMLQAIYQHFGGRESSMTPELVSQNAVHCPYCRRALDTIAGFLATFAANAALTFSAKRGVYIGGGLAAALDAESIEHFSRRYQDRGLASDQIAKMPAYAILDEYTTLSGLAAFVSKTNLL